MGPLRIVDPVAISRNVAEGCVSKEAAMRD
jgi:hypothetical protein